MSKEQQRSFPCEECIPCPSFVSIVLHLPHGDFCPDDIQTLYITLPFTYVKFDFSRCSELIPIMLNKNFVIQNVNKNSFFRSLLLCELTIWNHDVLYTSGTALPKLTHLSVR